MLCLRRYILIALAYAAVVLWIIEGGTNSEEFPSAKNTDQLKRSMFTMAQSFLSGGDHRLQPHTSAGRILLMSVSFAVLVLMTTYTANMTTTKSKVSESYYTIANTAPLHPSTLHHTMLCFFTHSLAPSLASLPWYNCTVTVAQGGSAPYKDLADAVAKRARICGYKVYFEMVKPK